MKKKLIRLLLDKRRGAVSSPYGAEVVINGDFATDLTGWEGHNLSPLTWDSGRCRIDSDGDAVRNINGGWQLTAGTTYLLSLDIELGSGVWGDVYDGTNAEYIIARDSITTDGTKTIQYTPTVNATQIRFYQRNAGSAWYDNISFKEVL